MRIRDKIALVTGSGSGIGKAIAERFVKEGAKVILNDINEKKLDDTLSEIHNICNANCTGVVADVSETQDVDKLFKNIQYNYGKIDILVNNVGIAKDRTIVKMSDEEWDAVIKTNLRSYFLCSRNAVRIMKNNNYGRIVNISSRAWQGGFGQSNYSASKGGIISLTRTLGLELAKYGITVNAIAPGIINTPLFQSFSDNAKEKLYKMQPGGQIGDPESVAYAVLNFVDEEAWYITGQTLYVCGGKSLSSSMV